LARTAAQIQTEIDACTSVIATIQARLASSPVVQYQRGDTGSRVADEKMLAFQYEQRRRLEQELAAVSGGGRFRTFGAIQA
jgi:hypothetical protein